MRFLVDRCAGFRLTTWLREQGHDAMDLREIGKDPGDEQVLALAANQSRILVTIDTDFGELTYARQHQHAGLVRLPDVRSAERSTLLHEVLSRHSEDLETGAVITVRGRRIRVSQPPEH